MALLDRVATLIKANINDLIDKAEDPEKLLKQLLLDMQNQFMQVKTQVAIAIAGQHLLQKKHQENLNQQNEWLRKAELALQKNEDGLARMAVEHAVTYENASKNFTQQIEEQADQVQILRDALHRLEQKMTETRTRTELLIAQHRRAKLGLRAGLSDSQEFRREMVFDRMQGKVIEAEALQHGTLEAAKPDRFAMLEKSDQVDRLLADLRARTTRALT
jgi:phage shock protein A